MSAVLFCSFSTLLIALFTKDGVGKVEERLKLLPAPASAQSVGCRL